MHMVLFRGRRNSLATACMKDRRRESAAPQWRTNTWPAAVRTWESGCLRLFTRSGTGFDSASSLRVDPRSTFNVQHLPQVTTAALSSQLPPCRPRSNIPAPLCPSVPACLFEPGLPGRLVLRLSHGLRLQQGRLDLAAVGQEEVHEVPWFIDRTTRPSAPVLEPSPLPPYLLLALVVVRASLP